MPNPKAATNETGKPVRNLRQPVPGDALNSVVGSAGAAAAVTVTAPAAGTNETTPSVVISKVHCSYSAAPTAGGLTITDGTNTLFAIDITAAGYTPVEFNPPIKLAAGLSAVVTLLAPGGAVVGKLKVDAWADR